jgi:hypothetical protein
VKGGEIMETAFTTEHLKDLLVFPFQDKNWIIKFVLAFVLYWLGIFLVPYWFVLGYLYEIMRGIIVDREPPALPEWDDWENLLKNGLRLFGVSFIYSLPAFILMVLPQFMFFFMIPLAERGGFEEFLLPFVGMPIMWVLMGVAMVGLIAGLFFMMVAAAHMVAKDEFAAAFRINEWWPIFRRNVSGYILSFVLIAGIYLISIFVSQMLMITIVFCFVFPFAITFVMIYMQIIGSVLFAQAYNGGVDHLEAQSSSA